MQNLSNCIAASCNILMLLLALNCTYCAPSPFLYTLHSSQVMLWGRQRAERLPCLNMWRFEKSVKFVYMCNKVAALLVDAPKA